MLETLKPAAIMTAGVGIGAELTQDIPVISQQALRAEAPIPSAAAPWKQRKDTDLYTLFSPPVPRASRRAFPSAIAR